MTQHRSPAFASLLLGVVPLFAQDPAATREHTPEPAAVLFSGALPDNVVFPDPGAIVARDLNANDPMVAPFLKLLDTYTKFVDDNLKGFDGSMSQREAAFHAVNLILVTGIVWPPTLTATGATVGAIALSETGPGALGGGVAGGAIGGTAGTGVMCAQMLLAVAIALEMNDKYPEVSTRDLGMADGFDLPLFPDPEEWTIEDVRAERPADPEEASVGDRSLDDTRRSRAGRISRPGSEHAGPWESLFIHLVSEAAAPQIERLARYWHEYPGLSAGQKRQLQEFSRLRPFVERIAYIRANGRLSQNSKPARPLAGWQRQVQKLLAADEGAVQRLWLDCFAIGNTRLEVRNDKLTWTVPASLRAIGAPTSFSTSVPTLYPRVAGFGGSLSAAVEPADFRITLGSASIAGDRIRVRFDLAKGRLLDAKIKAELGPAKHQFTVSPSLRRDLAGHAEFAIDGYGLKLTKVALGRIDLTIGMPQLPPPVQGLQGLLAQIEEKLADAADELLGKRLGLDRVFDGIDQYVARQLLDVLNGTADRYGLARVDKLLGLSLRDGKLEARVQAMEWSGVPSLDSAIKRHAARVQQLGR